jgi:uncharacterized Ntn-hydrolase superfamily protein
VTFSVALADAETGTLGIGVASKYFAVGSIVPYASAAAGLVATQFFANPSFGARGLHLLASGASPAETLETLLADDPHRVRRQLVIMDCAGEVACFTGEACVQAAGERQRTGAACSGNTLVSPAVLDSAFATLTSSVGDVWKRLLSGLVAGQEAGGDKSGQQSASLLIVRPGAGYGGYSDRQLDIRVDDHPQPLTELARLVEVWLAERENVEP